MTIKEIVDSNRPVQVVFYDGEHMCSGIMFGDKIICGCCGGVFEVDDVISYAREDGVIAIKMLNNWGDFSDEIREEGINATVLELEIEEDC